MTSKIEELASKAVGTVKAAKASLEGLEGVFRHLVREHGEVSALLMKLKFTNEPEARSVLWQTIRRELLSHERAEMKEVYPVLRTEPDTQLMAAEHDEDAESLEEMVTVLNATAPDAPEWKSRLDRLIELVQEHVRDEEEEYFPIADRAFKDRSQDMLARFERAKAEAMKELEAKS